MPDPTPKGLRVTFLGTGTSVGIPVITCNCTVCGSSDERNKRLRASLLLEWALPARRQEGAESTVDPGAGDVDGQSGRGRHGRTTASVLVDTSTDFRQQALRARIDHVDAVVYTHTHADHVLGLDELRIYNFVHKRSIPLYGSAESLKVIRRIFEYAFEPDARAVPQLTLHEIGDSVELFGARVHALPVRHGRFDVFGFRVGDFGYVTDCSEIPEAAAAGLTDLDVLVIDALRREPHPSHFSLDEALREIERLRPRYAYLTHLTHVFDHAALQRELPKGVDVAYDGLVLDLDLPRVPTS